MHKAFVVHASLGGPLFPGDESQYEAVLLGLRHFVLNLTVEDVKAGLLEWPAGPGEPYLIPAMVQEGEGSSKQATPHFWEN